MTKPRQTSVAVLITLAELAWLAAFGMVFAYKGKVGELGAAQQRVALIAEGAKDVPKLVDERERARAEVTNLQQRLDSFRQYLGGKSIEEAGRLLKLASESEKLISETKTELKNTSDELTRRNASINELQSQLELTNKLLAEVSRKWRSVPTNFMDMPRLYQEATSNLVNAHARLESVGVLLEGLSNRIGALELGEIAIRRELIGLPSTQLHRVIFVADTSSSMRNSPAWQEARSLMRLWIEYLSVEECVLVTFNDKAIAFPQTGYHRVRDSRGTPLAEQKVKLMAAFDSARPGVYSDLLDALRLVYSRPSPDLIVLFTDGHPHVASKMDTSFGSAILKEVSQHPGIPILTVAVGSYEIENAGGPTERRNRAIAFLKQLASQTGGSFIGR